MNSVHVVVRAAGAVGEKRERVGKVWRCGGATNRRVSAGGECVAVRGAAKDRIHSGSSSLTKAQLAQLHSTLPSTYHSPFPPLYRSPMTLDAQPVCL